jgi:hypothetical protein
VTDHWRPIHTLLTLAFVIAIVVLVVLADREQFNPASSREPAVWIWLALVALMVGFLLVVGDGVTGRAGGILIGERNRMSLARLQMAAWTILVLSAYLTAMLVNVSAGRAEPLAISIPTELWLAMGISTTSLLGSRLILGSRSELEARQTGSPVRGKVDERATPAEARYSDLFCGDFEAGTNLLDLTKVQMFFFTIVLVLGYAVATAELFVNAAAEGLGALPKLDESFVILLAISHGTYLTRKALPDTRTAPANTSPPTITGTPAVGQTLTAAPGAWTPEPDEITYRWERYEADGSGGSSISGATQESYILAPADEGKKIKVVVTATNSSGSANLASALTDAVIA